MAAGNVQYKEGKVPVSEAGGAERRNTQLNPKATEFIPRESHKNFDSEDTGLTVADCNDRHNGGVKDRPTNCQPTYQPTYILRWVT